VPHAVELRDGDVGLVDKQQEISWKIIEQRRRT
jgi:hypothetical protein